VKKRNRKPTSKEMQLKFYYVYRFRPSSEQEPVYQTKTSYLVPLEFLFTLRASVKS
jgi:hypothetical protein